jgi:hypothetical protein
MQMPVGAQTDRHLLFIIRHEQNHMSPLKKTIFRYFGPSFFSTASFFNIVLAGELQTTIYRWLKPGNQLNDA